MEMKTKYCCFFSQNIVGAQYTSVKEMKVDIIPIAVATGVVHLSPQSTPEATCRHFLSMLRFPESLYHKVSSGCWGMHDQVWSCQGINSWEQPTTQKAWSWWVDVPASLLLAGLLVRCAPHGLRASLAQLSLLAYGVACSSANQASSPFWPQYPIPSELQGNEFCEVNSCPVKPLDGKAVENVAKLTAEFQHPETWGVSEAVPDSWPIETAGILTNVCCFQLLHLW